MEGQSNIKNKFLWYAMGTVIILLFLVTRFLRVTSIPAGLHIDEIGMAYDAWSLSQYGFNRYLKSWPVYLNNFGSGQSALYCYLCAGLFKLFGYHVILVRLPGIFTSFLTLIFGILLTKKIFSKELYLSLLTGFMVVVCPYFIMASRFGLDCNLMLGFSGAFLYFFTCAMEKGRYRWYILAGFFGGLVLYTYAISYLVMILFLVSGLLYIIRCRRFSFWHWLSMAIPMGILAFPLLLVQLINIFELSEMTLGIFTIVRLIPYRGAEIGMPQWSSLIQTLKSIFGGDDLIYNSIPGLPNLTYLTLPFFVIGLVDMVYRFFCMTKRKTFDLLSFPLLWFASMLFIGSMIDSNSNKINGIFLTVVVIAVDGIHVLIDVLKTNGKKIALIAGIAYSLCFLYFANYYYTGKYTADNYPLNYFWIMVSEAIGFLEENPQYQNLGTYMAQPGICFALSSLQSPEELGKITDVGVYNEYYHTGSLQMMGEGYNYIVTDIYADFADELRAMGYTEINYTGYSLFLWNSSIEQVEGEQ